MKKKLIALDMDGTLLDSNGKISAENQAAIKAARDAGHIVMICSGRHHDSLSVFLAVEGLAGLPIAANNGAVSLVDEEIIDCVQMKQTAVETLSNWLADHQYPFVLYAKQGVYSHVAFLERAEYETKMFDAGVGAGVFAKNPARARVYFKKLITQEFECLTELPTDLEFVKLFALTPDPIKKAAFEKFAYSIDGLTVTSSHTDNVEVSDTRGHKGTGITAVARSLGIPIEDTVAIGDNFNDVGMFEIAGMAIAMGNAEPAIKAMADMVTLSNDEHGVAHAIWEYLLS